MQIAPANENYDEENEEEVPQHCYKAAELEVDFTSWNFKSFSYSNIHKFTDNEPFQWNTKQRQHS